MSHNTTVTLKKFLDFFVQCYPAVQSSPTLRVTPKILLPATSTEINKRSHK